jgi:twinkle protein
MAGFTFEPRPGRGGLAEANKTFVSKHFQIPPEEIEAYLKRKSINATRSGEQFKVKMCPFCHDIKNDLTNMNTLSILADSGAHNCFRCGAKGSWFDFKKRMGDLRVGIAKVGDGGPAEAPAGAEGSSTELTTARVADRQAEAVAAREEGLEPIEDLQNYPAAMGGIPSDSLKHCDSPDPSSLSDLSDPPDPSDPSHPVNPFNLPSGMPKVREWLVSRGLNPPTLEMFGVGATKAKFLGVDNKWSEYECVTFPWRQLIPKHGPKASAAPGEVIKVKLRAWNEKRFMRLHPKSKAWGFFGWNTVPPESPEVIITEGELDAMACWQATGIPTISLPNGARSLPVELVPALEGFDTIYLWLDDDMPGQEGAELFAKKLGVGRCYLVCPSVQCPDALEQVDPKTGATVKLPCKDANDALKMGLDLTRLVRAAQLLPHDQIITFDSLRASVYGQFLHADQYAGLPAVSLPGLTELLQGHRNGELTIVTGSTGVGKTTFLSQLSLDYCSQGVNTLWGSFELKNERMAKKMITQFAGIDFEQNLPEFDKWADRFEELPLYFLKFFGSTDLDQVLDAMDYACYVFDVQHILLDNLQFMLAGQTMTIDKYALQDRAIDAFRKFASNRNVHITLVIHPRKESDPNKLTVSSIFGTAKSTQEADTVLIIGTPPGAEEGSLERVLEVKKNRFNGKLGKVELEFDPVSNH